MREDDLADVWARSLADLADMQIEPHQRAWLQLTRPLGLVENTALIAAPNDFVKEQLETRLRALITNALSRERAPPATTRPWPVTGPTARPASTSAMTPSIVAQPSTAGARSTRPPRSTMTWPTNPARPTTARRHPPTAAPAGWPRRPCSI